MFYVVIFKVVKLVRICQLGSSQLEEANRRELWFPLLDVLLSTQPKIAHLQNLAHGENVCFSYCFSLLT